MRDKQVHILNDILEETYLGIDSYNKYLNHIDDSDLRHKLESQEKAYRDNASQLASHIRNLGGNPKDNPGLRGVVSTAVNTMRLAGEDKTVKSLEMVKDTLQNAIDTKEDFLNELSGDTRQLVDSQLQTDKAFLSEIDSYIHETMQ